MWELDCEESRVSKNWCFWTVVLEKTLESPLGCKEIQSVHSIRDQSWVFFGRTDAEAKTRILWPPHAKSWLIGKDPDAGRDWGQEEKGTTEDEMVDGITDSMDMSLSELREMVMDKEAWRAPTHGSSKSWTQLSNWTELNCISKDEFLGKNVITVDIYPPQQRSIFCQKTNIQTKKTAKFNKCHCQFLWMWLRANSVSFIHFIICIFHIVLLKIPPKNRVKVLGRVFRKSPKRWQAFNKC